MDNDRGGGFFNALHFGLSGTGRAETRAIQDAVDACASAGGGTVLIPPGKYLSGTIFLKSNVNLHLSAGAEIIGSPYREDYNADDVFPENSVFSQENVSGAHLVIAYCLENVSISGAGRINGNSRAFFEEVPRGAGIPPGEEMVSFRFKNANYPIKGWRPGQMLYFCRCENVGVKDVSLINSPYWTLFFHGCTGVSVSGVTVDNPPATANGDGIDIDCCRNVTVEGCMVRSGDDCITLRGSNRRLGEHAQPCENVAITNCVLSTPQSAFRVGVGDGQVRRCTISNIVVSEARIAVSINSRYGSSAKHGVEIEDVHFSDFVADVDMPFVITAGQNAARPAAIRNVSFSRFRAVVSAGSLAAGTPEVPVEGLKLSDVEFRVRGGTENLLFHSEMPDEESYPAQFVYGYSGFAGRPALPCVFYGTGLRDAVFENIRIEWNNPSGVWREGLHFKNAVGLRLKNLMLRQPGEEIGAAVLCRACGKVEMSGCRAEEGTGVFLRMENSASPHPLRCLGNDFSEAKEPLLADVPVEEAGNLYSGGRQSR